MKQSLVTLDIVNANLRQVSEELADFTEQHKDDKYSKIPTVVQNEENLSFTKYIIVISVLLALKLDQHT